MKQEPKLSKASAMKRARELEFERAAVERKGGMDVWRRSRRPMQIVIFTVPCAVGTLLGFAAMIAARSALTGLVLGGAVAIVVFIIVGIVLGGVVATDAMVSEGRKGFARRRIVRERKALFDATEMVGGVELANEARSGGEISPAEPTGGLTPVEEPHDA